LRQAITLKPDFAEAYYNLGITLQELGRLDEAEASYTQAIALKPDFAEAHSNLDILLNKKKLLMKIFEAKKYRDNIKIRNLDSEVRLVSNPFISNREVETNLISNLYKIRLKHLDKTKGPKTKGPLFGNGKTTDFSFFKDNQSIIKDVENDLSVIMRQAVRSKIYVYESFLNIFNNGSGSLPHDHLDSFDKINNLINQKFSLQYYLSVGDQTCSEPGIFKLKDPDEEILPTNGMIMIIPASRLHSAVYNGKVDRVMIGVNFYSLL
jgi:tetratricopeptide (TPR) repeat protein